MDKQHIIYKITSTLNNRFYVGMHTGYPDDRYFGSGKRLKAEIKKYGKNNFKKEILETVSNRKALELREAEIVNDALLANPLCLNLKNGGEGGGELWHEVHRQKLREAGQKTGSRNISKLNVAGEEAKRRGKKAALTRENRGVGLTSSFWIGRIHRDETKKKISLAQIGKQDGEKNSQFGTCWVTNRTPIKIKKELLDSYLRNGNVRGRK